MQLGRAIEEEGSERLRGLESGRWVGRVEEAGLGVPVAVEGGRRGGADEGGGGDGLGLREEGR